MEQVFFLSLSLNMARIWEDLGPHEAGMAIFSSHPSIQPTLPCAQDNSHLKELKYAAQRSTAESALYS
jgi:hypothetical protein